VDDGSIEIQGHIKPFAVTDEPWLARTVGHGTMAGRVTSDPVTRVAIRRGGHVRPPLSSPGGIRESAMPTQPRRKATIADAMLLIIGAGFALASWRYIMWMPVWSGFPYSLQYFHFQMWMSDRIGFPNSLQRYHFQALGTVAFLIPLSLSLLVIALR